MACFEHAASAGPAVSGLKELPLESCLPWRESAARQHENPSTELPQGLHRPNVTSSLGPFIIDIRNAESLNRGHKPTVNLLKASAHRLWHHRKQERAGNQESVRKKM